MINMDGYIHSLESFGTVDGPGIRFVVFCQGCPMRCKYCHNPDTWKTGVGTRMSPEELLEQFNKNRPFYQKGGITVTGGEPLLQVDFLLDFFRLAKKENIHTCIDTSGITYRSGESEYNQKLDELLKYTDLVMLDLKHMDREAHKELTTFYNDGILDFVRHLEEKHIPVWIRHVVVPGITDSREHLQSLGRFIASLSNVKALDVLPYHTMGVGKYRELGLDYPLGGVEAMSVNEAAEAKKIILESFYQARGN